MFVFGGVFVEDIIKKSSVNIKKDKVINSFERVIEDYTQEDNEIVQIELISGQKFFITTKDIYYKKDHYTLKHLFYEEYYDEAERRTKCIFDEEKALKNIRYIGFIGKTKLEFLKDGIKIENYGNLEPVSRENYLYSLWKIYVPNSSILTIKPFGKWQKPDESIRITERKIIEVYNKYK